eukprot:TRINITY_DN2412_c0_g1_i1.p1 TRINITY_DN2412_c0_g1~~TRINITY_DN2412_c0_g1_i1.p1  ORF type:complete len:208 (+),score=30.56 TRINITY_DN2412_c0_g1_i1:23-625(+)
MFASKLFRFGRTACPRCVPRSTRSLSQWPQASISRQGFSKTTKLGLALAATAVAGYGFKPTTDLRPQPERDARDVAAMPSPPPPPVEPEPVPTEASDRFTRTLQRIVGQAGVGGFLGFALGYAAKKSMRMMLIILGAEFAFLQVLAYVRFITVHWDTILQQLRLVGNRQSLADTLRGIFTYRFPLKAGLAVGFWGGFSYG